MSDGRGIVRVWVEDCRLSRVRVSPQWHAKLGRRSLADCFTQALAFAHIGVADVPMREDVGHGDMDFSQLPPCDARALAAFRSVFAEVEERWGEALVRHEEHTPGSAPATLGKYRTPAASA